MRDLTPVRLTGGGTMLVLTDGNGAEYVVPVAGLRDTLGHTLDSEPQAPQETPAMPTANPKEPTMESSLRPRDIQARIRAGESPDDVAAVAGTSVDKVMIFASPVLAERAHVAETAMGASVRRSSTESVTTPRTLGPAAASRLREEGVDPESVVWDAWRREDGRWTLQASYAHEGQNCAARFSFDQPGHFVAPDDDEGRWLVGDGTFAPRIPAQQGLRLAPVPAHHGLGDDVIEMVQDDSPVTPVARTGDLSETVAAVRAARVSDVDSDLLAGTADADWMAALPDPEPEPVPVVDGAAAVDEPFDEEPAQDDRENTADEPRTQLPRRTTAKKARGRAQVPSWDEIMFGGGTGD